MARRPGSPEPQASVAPVEAALAPRCCKQLSRERCLGNGVLDVRQSPLALLIKC